MNKIKSVKKKNKSHIKFKGVKGQNILESKIHAINSGQVECLLKIKAEGDVKFNLIYDTQGLISLREYLSMPLTSKTFSGLLNNILSNLNSMKESFFDYHKVLFDVDYVMINPSYRTVYFAFVPAEPFENPFELRSLLADIIKVGTFDPHENSSHIIEEYITMLNKGLSFSSFDLEEFIKKLSLKKENIPTSFAVCRQCGAQMPSDIAYCRVCGENLNREFTVNPYVTYVSAAPRMPSEHNAARVSFYLVRERNGDIIEILPPRTVLGKDPLKCNYAIKDNPSISRIHAGFFVRGGHLFVEDYGSTNFTFINSKAVEPENPCELFSGSRVLLANEVFLVNTK